uniref:Uncharacterized protein n=2 Tax=Pseudomonas aeruginosa TaxID=287 RepID=A0A6C0L575_PSEAI|nr:hypothetical protein [Pseudomonas aeruginosa]
MKNDKVLCRRCGKMMVPKVILSRGVYGGYGWWIGGGRPVSSCCPFCLSENWDDSSRPEHRSPPEKICLVILILLGVTSVGEVFRYIAGDLLGLALSDGFEMVLGWGLIIVGIIVYRKFRFRTWESYS